MILSVLWLRRQWQRKPRKLRVRIPPRILRMMSRHCRRKQRRLPEQEWTSAMMITRRRKILESRSRTENTPNESQSRTLPRQVQRCRCLLRFPFGVLHLPRPPSQGLPTTAPLPGIRRSHLGCIFIVLLPPLTVHIIDTWMALPPHRMDPGVGTVVTSLVPTPPCTGRDHPPSRIRWCIMMLISILRRPVLTMATHHPTQGEVPYGRVPLRHRDWRRQRATVARSVDVQPVRRPLTPLQAWYGHPLRSRTSQWCNDIMYRQRRTMTITTP
jgi:hypothetical protein